MNKYIIRRMLDEGLIKKGEFILRNNDNNDFITYYGIMFSLIETENGVTFTNKKDLINTKNSITYTLERLDDEKAKEDKSYKYFIREMNIRYKNRKTSVNVINIGKKHKFAIIEKNGVEKRVDNIVIEDSNLTFSSFEDIVKTFKKFIFKLGIDIIDNKYLYKSEIDLGKFFFKHWTVSNFDDSNTINEDMRIKDILNSSNFCVNIPNMDYITLVKETDGVVTLCDAHEGANPIYSDMLYMKFYFEKKHFFVENNIMPCEITVYKNSEKIISIVICLNNHFEHTNIEIKTVYPNSDVYIKTVKDYLENEVKDFSMVMMSELVDLYDKLSLAYDNKNGGK